MWGKGNTSALLVGAQTGTAPLDISMAISQKIRKLPSSRPRNTTCWVDQSRIINHTIKDVQSYHKDMCSTMIIAALFIITRT